jgi:hypothetical protein
MRQRHVLMTPGSRSPQVHRARTIPRSSARVKTLSTGVVPTRKPVFTTKKRQRPRHTHNRTFNHASLLFNARLSTSLHSTRGSPKRSGWVNDRVVTSRLLGALRKALRRGVHVFIVFGYKSKYKEISLKSDARNAVGAVHEVARESARWKRGYLLLAHRPVHAKIIVRDEVNAKIGSNNWLSNSSFVNEERSVVVTDGDFVAQVLLDMMQIAWQADSNAIPRLLSFEALAAWVTPYRDSVTTVTKS